MRVRVDSGALREALSLAGRFVDMKSTLPVLGHVLVKTNGTGLEVAGTNLTVWVRCHVAGAIEEEGQLTLPARRLNEFLAALGKTHMTITASGSKATLVAANGKSTVSGFDAEEFPVMQEASGPTLQIRGRELHTALSRVLAAAAPDDSRPVLAGCLVQTVDSKLELVAADGFRLARTELPILAGDLDQSFAVIVPARALAEARSMLPTKGDEEVTLRVGLDKGVATLFELETERAKFSSKLVEGQFPDFNRIVPREFKATATVASEDLERATKSIRAVLGVKEPITRIALKQGVDGAAGEMVVSGKDAETGESEFTLPAQVELADPGQGPVLVAFNGRYLVDALSSIDTQQVTLGASGPSSPGLFRAPGGMRPESYVVVMPMHVAR